MEKDLQTTLCPICATDRFDREVYRMNFRHGSLDDRVFSARRLPDRLHYRMVRCRRCGLLRSNPILPIEELSRLYEGSHYTYAREADYTRRTYATYLRKAMPFVRERGRLLEIGCGSGFFLVEALRQGFQEAEGIEPSREAVESAPARVRAGIKLGLYRRDSFSRGRFDAVCAFQVFDHVPDQKAMLQACFEHLRPGGMALFINHDRGGLLSRILGERSPIVDVEHTALFDKSTMRRIFTECGFRVRRVFDVRNTYPLSYWAHLAPLPGSLKAAALSFLSGSTLGKLPVTLQAGNLGLVATRD